MLLSLVRFELVTFHIRSSWQCSRAIKATRKRSNLSVLAQLGRSTETLTRQRNERSKATCVVANGLCRLWLSPLHLS